MKEVGIDISNQKSKDITEDMMGNSTKIVNIGCMDKPFCLTYIKKTRYPNIKKIQ
jgi:protein-tyrosine-phosphatase